MATDAVVRSRIDRETKRRAAEALAAMGLSISDAIRLLMMRVADEKRLPFEIKAPNAATVLEMDDLARGKGKKLDGPDALFKDLGL
jgi:DNA-damage-inducible protein J